MSFRLRFKYRLRAGERSWAVRQFSRWLKSAACRVVLGCALVGFGLGYLLITNRLATSGFEIQHLEARLAALTAEVQRLDSEVAEFESVEKIHQRLPEVALTEPRSRRYFTVKSGPVVAKR